MSATARIGIALPKYPAPWKRPKRSGRVGAVTRIWSATCVLAPGASGRPRRISSAVQSRRRAPNEPPPRIVTWARLTAQPPNAFAQTRSQTEVSGAELALRNAICSVPESVNRRAS